MIADFSFSFHFKALAAPFKSDATCTYMYAPVVKKKRQQYKHASDEVTVNCLLRQALPTIKGLFHLCLVIRLHTFYNFPLNFYLKTKKRYWYLILTCA